MYEPELVRLRRELHQHPELGLVLPRTQERVLKALDGLPVEISLGSGLSSITAVLRGQKGAGRTVLLRADMDALPVRERVDLVYSSREDDRMHACGHDLHTAMLVGAVRCLAAQRDSLAGSVVFMFQPGEEGFDGARRMIDEGVLEAGGVLPDAALALHVVSSVLPHGRFATRTGPVLAAAAALRIRLIGKSGHGSAPHRAHDPVPAACELVLALQSMVTRRFDVFDPVVLTVGMIRAGVRDNVIPDVAEVDATVRAFSVPTHERAIELARQVCKGIAAAHGLEVEVEVESGYPSTINDGGVVEAARSVVHDHLGPERWSELAQPFTGSEDFSRVLQRVPGAMVFLGACPPGADPGTAAFNHASGAVFDDDVLVDGSVLLAGFAREALAAPA